jgi:hypothetical protein
LLNFRLELSRRGSPPKKSRLTKAGMKMPDLLEILNSIITAWIES